LDIEYSSTNDSRNRTPSLFSSRPESPTESTDERQMLLDVEQNIANLERTFTDNRRLGERQQDTENNGGKEVVVGAGSRTAPKKGLFRYSSFSSDKDVGGGNDRKRWDNPCPSLPIVDEYTKRLCGTVVYNIIFTARTRQGFFRRLYDCLSRNVHEVHITITEVSIIDKNNKSIPCLHHFDSAADWWKDLCVPTIRLSIWLHTGSLGSRVRRDFSRFERKKAVLIKK